MSLGLCGNSTLLFWRKLYTHFICDSCVYRFHLSTDVTAAEVREIGLREVARIKASMEEVCYSRGARNINRSQRGGNQRWESKLAWKRYVSEGNRSERGGLN